MDTTEQQHAHWAQDEETIFSSYNTTREGLSTSESENRVLTFGKNIFKNKEKKTALSIFIEQLLSPLIFILIGAVVVTALLKEWTEVIIISIVILVNAGLGFYREYHAEHTLEKLETFIKDRTRVLRDHFEQEIDSELVVPGDIIKLSFGNRIPADARIISVNNLRVDEAILTGESNPVEKKSEILSRTTPVAERVNMVHAGTLVTEGFATAVVVATGNNTQIGAIAALVSTTGRTKTPIQKGMSKIAWLIFILVLFIVIGIFILGVARGEPIFEMLILAVAVSVGAVPEALPIALTVILSIGVERIAQKKGITRTLMAAETLGSTSLIMTDKTGTLTEANMKLVGIFRTEEILSGKSEGMFDAKDNAILEMALRNIDVLIENPEEDVSLWQFRGKPFEVHIAKTAQERNLDISFLQGRDIGHLHIPFNSTHKFSVSQQSDEYTIMGAPDVLLSNAAFSSEEYQKIEAWIQKISAEGKRLIAVASLPVTEKQVSKEDIKGSTLLGVLAFFDPVRKEVPAAIKKIESLGVKVVMITGDLKGTAVSVANSLGWNVSDAEILTGADIRQMNDEQLSSVLPSIKIFTRVTPEEKLRVGVLYQSLGEVVAMTGDGVNDAPALKAMDIGVALGSGSDVAKSASGLVLLDDNFQTISAAIIEGRRILSNIRKTFVYLMSNSLDEVFVIGGSLLCALPLPLTALQIIWVNLFTGSLPALAFAYDENFDQERTRHVRKTLFSTPVKVLTFGIGILSSILLFVMYYVFIKIGVEESVARSVFFVCFASYILAVSFSFRSLTKPLFSYPLFSNKRLNQSIIIAGTLLILTMVLPAMRNLFGLAPLPFSWLGFVLVWIVLNVLLVEGAKFFFRQKNRN